MTTLAPPRLFAPRRFVAGAGKKIFFFAWADVSPSRLKPLIEKAKTGRHEMLDLSLVSPSSSGVLRH
jgi:hypothetical protein